jgi:RHS repeat-associated protein
MFYLDVGTTRGEASSANTYDSNGNTLTKVVGSNTTNYAWDFENRLTSVTLPGTGGTVSFKYDPFGRRVYKSSSAGTSVFAYDGDNLVEETNSAGTVVARYEGTQNIDEPLAMLRSGATSYYHADGLGSITSLSNAAGALAQTYTFDSFGEQTASSGSLTNPFRFTARDFDSETNLQFSRARYYDPNVGRFLSEDPFAFGGGINFYAYVGNDSTNFTDPLGLECKPKCFAQLKYRPTDPTKPNGMTHAFWYVQGSDGKQFIVEGGFTKPVGGSLNVWPPEPTGNGAPKLLAPVWWSSGVSSSNCEGVDNLLKAAGAWPQNTIPYWWEGPNSNSAAKSLGGAGGFSPTAPPNSTGWDVPLPRPNNH